MRIEFLSRATTGSTMIELHVWGYEEEISILSPSCIASAWILNLLASSHNIQFKIIPSNNTHLSKLNELPLLIDDGKQYSGFKEIAGYLSSRYQSDYFVSLSGEEKLIDDGLVTVLNSKFNAVNNYNLFSNTKNYENYTRKLFAKLFPFPMMYNQASKFYNEAQSQVRLLGLGESKSSFLNITGNGDETQTEFFSNDSDDVGDTPKAISSLHEKSIVQKSETKRVLRESKSTMKCLLLVEQLFDRLEKLKSEQKQASKFIFGDKPSAGDILFLAYFHCLTHQCLPDKFMRKYLASNSSDRFQSIMARLDAIQSKKLSSDSFRQPVGKEIPNLVNEVGFWTGLVSY
ncbi:SAM37 [Candida theae]|uniref:SAM37 n=1 Tax=Candida theae TaxID=1198502 RepID=A0AAD5FY44_9ASCO|nr:SAM37 [Candida theae]KAI5957607.1 SAM37 [Candida theae]